MVMNSVNPRNRRLLSDLKKIEEEFKDHQFINILYTNDVYPPEKYTVYYSGIKSIALSPKSTADNKIFFEIFEHKVDIELHINYPRYKPMSIIKTDIFHPNFRSAYPHEICIGDYWAPGEDLADIIYKIGEMIQYKTYNIKSPLNGIAAKWARENINLFPLDNTELRKAQSTFYDTEEEKQIEINLF
jgi:ubiquitin-protein ligase